MSVLLPYHKTCLEEVHDPASSDLLLIARGLGLRRIVCTLLKIYYAPNALVLIIGATGDEEAGMGDELGIMGVRKPGMRTVAYETPRKDRQDLYVKGGLLSMSSQICVVDMLQSVLDPKAVTGIVVLHAERVTATSTEAFIFRLFRERNTEGFVKAFSDQPELITSGLSPLRAITKELQVRKVHVYPRFHEQIQQTLERRKADVVELYVEMTDNMSAIHDAIVACINATLNELKRSTHVRDDLDLEDFTVQNAYFKSFDSLVRRQLDPIWHRVGIKTKQLVNDLGTLRDLLSFLLTYDGLQLHSYLETLLLANASAAGKVHRSPWLMTDSANIIIQAAKRRCYINSNVKQQDPDDEDAWDALDEIQGAGSNSSRKNWIPRGMEPVLEELPKWKVLADVIHEIEETIMSTEPRTSFLTPGTNTVLVMTSSDATCDTIRDYLSSSSSRAMMERRLRGYLYWKRKVALSETDTKSHRKHPAREEQSVESEALRMKDAARQAQVASRRRVRGGAPANASQKKSATNNSNGPTDVSVKEEADDIVKALGEVVDTEEALLAVDELQLIDDEFDIHFGLIPPEQTVLVRSYSADDTDDRVLAEIKPRYVVMYEPNADFIRRIEVYRAANPGLSLRVYFMVYKSSTEEHKYLAGIRKEKESMERLIKERGSMLMTIHEDKQISRGEQIIKNISTRIAGGSRVVNDVPEQVIVDMREFRSSLPGLLHAANVLVVPATLTVGDYILTPDIAVERKSIPDLISSFNKGRLYAQCELMSAHYKTPVLLIEFEEHKSFSLGTVAEQVTTEAKPYMRNNKGPPRNNTNSTPTESNNRTGIQAKIVLLTLAFPRLRIIWSPSPFESAQIFRELKQNALEPDPRRAVSIGAEDPESGAFMEVHNAIAEDMLRALPGVTSKNIKYVMSKAKSLRAFCQMSLEEVQEILGSEPGKACFDFMHEGERQ